VIYDSFVERAVTILQCLDEDLAKYPRLNNPPDIKTNNYLQLVTNYYINYQNIVKALLSKYQNTINKLKTDLKTDYNYDLRIMDKTLWLMGNARKGFKLDKISCELEKPSN